MTEIKLPSPSEAPPSPVRIADPVPRRTVHEIYNLRDQWLRKSTPESKRTLTDHQIRQTPGGELHIIMAVWTVDGTDEFCAVDGPSYEDVVESAIEGAIKEGAGL